MTFKLILALTLLAPALSIIYGSPSVSTQYVPILKRHPGLYFPGENAVVDVELIYDPVCGTTEDVDQIIRKVIEQLGQSHPGKFNYRFGIQALPYHISAFKISQAIQYVAGQQGPAQALKVMRYFLDSSSQEWGYDSLKKLSVSGFMSKVADAVSQITKLDSDQINKALIHMSAAGNQTRDSVKYSMGTLHISGTPQIYINGARIDKVATKTQQEWITLLTSLL